ncbi:MAG: T9SS type A sorting domain-containing protein [Bacteroidetes bacterium]|nr:T9SS type A sorting domain-containing protein [Bacteroidota bacterium]
MKTINCALRLTVVLSVVLPLILVSGSSAQIVVPKGWENKHAIRFAMFLAGSEVWQSSDTAQLHRQLDSLGVNWDGEWSTLVANPGYSNSIVGSTTAGVDPIAPAPWDVARFKQLPYYALPYRIPDRFLNGLMWRYNDANGINPDARSFNNTYDSNDISPFSLYPAKHAYVIDTFHTYRYGGVDQRVNYGDEGRVILGMSDIRNANGQFIESSNRYFYPISGGYRRVLGPYHYPDTNTFFDYARGFSVTAVFNVANEIDTALANGRPTDSLPLVRLQVLFKHGVVPLSFPTGQSVLPMVPYRTAAQPSNPGWYALIDTVITKSIYNSLDDDWRVQDTLANGTAARSWKFKQLHLILKNLPSDLLSLADGVRLNNDNNFQKFGDGSGNAYSTYIHPDSLVDDPLDTALQRLPILEIRLLSTYRDSVRVRSLAFEDTTADKFYYRKMIGDTSHSREPNGAVGGFDDVLDSTMSQIAAAVSPRLWECFGFDTWQPFHAYSQPAFALIDFIGSKYHLYSHIHEQDMGNYILHYRRDRLSYDGRVPSMYENEATPWYNIGVCPGDYVYYGHTNTIAPALGWPNTADTTMGVLYTRRTSSDPYKSYRAFDTLNNGLDFLSSTLRLSTLIARAHPKGKQFAVEFGIPAWGELHIADGSVKTPALYWDSVAHHWVFLPKNVEWHQQIMFPEAISGLTYGALANGITAFNDAQGFDDARMRVNAPGLLCPESWSSTLGGKYTFRWSHDFNFGHARGSNNNDSGHVVFINDTNDVNGGFPAYYLGYSNTFRTVARIISRINSAYDTLARMTWLGAYTHFKTAPGHYTYSPSDSATEASAFLKVLSTSSVKLWQRGRGKTFVDSAAIDSANRTFVEVGLFFDSVTTARKNYAALLVNTRVYPSIRDDDDSLFFNKGFEASNKQNQRARSIYGDIDVRKVTLKIDTTMMPTSMRSHYYVVHDLWRKDTNWLVTPDSSFSVYIKPGDAKFLYFEPGISIRASTGAATSGMDFAYNNGRRVAERMKGTRTIEAYTRGGKLFVSNASRGLASASIQIESDGDNTATGGETLIDGTTTCARPSVCVARNDTAVALVYWKNNQLFAAYQSHPDSAWITSFANFTYNAIDTSSGLWEVTPVLTPASDNLWMVAAGFNGDAAAGKLPGIVGARFKLDTVGGITQVVWVNDPFTYLFQDGVKDTTDFLKSEYPTVSSRPIPDSLWPIRLAWQKAGNILYRRIKWSIDSLPPVLDGMTIISRGLPSYCTNQHPSIATIGYENDIPTAWKNGVPTPIPSNTSINDYVTWEAQINAPPRYTSNTKSYPVLKTRTQPINTITGSWARSFLVFKPDTTSTGYRYPIVTAENRAFALSDVMVVGKPRGSIISPRNNLDYVRVMWQNFTSHRLDLASWLWGWTRGGLRERGLAPSLALSTDSISHRTHTSSVPRSIVFVGEQSSGSDKQLRITNGWVPYIDVTAPMVSRLQFSLDSTGVSSCTSIKSSIVGVVPTVTVQKSGGPALARSWAQIDVTDPTILGESWPTTAPNPIEVYSDTFSVQSGDSILVPRRYDLNDITIIRNSLASGTDTLSLDLILRSFRDSSVIGTVEHAWITKTAINFPGYGLDTSSTRYMYTGPADSAFITMEVKRSQTDSLVQAYIEYEDNDSLPVTSYKRPTTQPSVTATEPLGVSIVPNPLSLTAAVNISLPAEAVTTVELYDIGGKRMQVLYSDVANGELHLTLDGSTLACGMYLLRVQSGSTVVTRKVELMK